MFGSNFAANFGIPSPDQAPQQAGSPLANPSPLSPQDQAAMSPETFANPAVSQVLGNLGKTAASAVLAPGRALASDQPITSEQMIKPAADIAGLTTLGAGAVPAEANALRAGAKLPGSKVVEAYKNPGAVKPISEMNAAELAEYRAQVAAEDAERARSFEK